MQGQFALVLTGNACRWVRSLADRLGPWFVSLRARGFEYVTGYLSIGRYVSIAGVIGPEKTRTSIHWSRFDSLRDVPPLCSTV